MRRKRWQRGGLKQQWNGSRMMWVGQWWEKGHRRSKTLGDAAKMTRGEAQALLYQYVEDHNAALLIPLSDPLMTFDQFLFQVYLPEQKRHWKASTAVTTEASIKSQLLPTLGARPMRAITRAELQRFLNKLAEDTTRAGLANARGWLTGIFRLAYADGLIRVNPAAKLYIPRECKEPKPTPTLTADQVVTYLSALAIRERVIARLAIYEGMRPGEILALRWSDIGTRAIVIERRIYSGQLDTPKNGHSRKAALSDGTRAALEEYKQVAPLKGIDDYVFPATDLQRPTEPATVRDVMIRALTPVGLRWATFRVLRRTNATLMHAAGIDPKVGAEQRGHGIGVSLDVYTKIGTEQKVKALRKLEHSINVQTRERSA